MFKAHSTQNFKLFLKLFRDRREVIAVCSLFQSDMAINLNFDASKLLDGACY